MSLVCDPEMLEALVRDELPPPRAAAALTHADECPSCREELGWLRREHQLFAGRAAAAPRREAELWAAVERRIAPAPLVCPERSGWRARALYAVGGLAAAAALAMAVGGRALPGGSAPARRTGGGSIAWSSGAPRSGPQRALDRAEREYEEATAILESEYAAAARRQPGRVTARFQEALTAARAEVSAARRTAGDDLDARERVLDGYATYAQSLQNAVYYLQSDEDARPGARPPARGKDLGRGGPGAPPTAGSSPHHTIDL